MGTFEKPAQQSLRRFNDEFDCEDVPIGNGATCRVFRCWRKLEFVETLFIWKGNTASSPSSRVAIKGSFFGWQEEQLMTWNEATCQHEAIIPLPLGIHEFKFYVDGAWSCSEAHPKTGEAVQNNIVHVQPSVRYAVKKYFGRLKSEMMREVQNLQSMRHEHIVAVHDWFVDADDGSLCLVTELCEGGNLQEVLTSHRGRLPPALLKQVFRQILLAMDFCHRSHIIHGDMKLAQVLLKRPIDPQPLSHHAKVSNNASAVHIKVADFGDSRFCLRHSMDSTSAGTSGYRAPELLLNEAATTAVDAFSVGIMLARCLDLGVAPFKCNHELMVKNSRCCVFAYAQGTENPSSLGCRCPISGQYPAVLMKSGFNDNDLLRKTRVDGMSACGVDFQTVNVNDAFWEKWASRKGCSLQPLLALDLVRRLCQRHPNDRLSAFQALNHPWFQSDSSDFFRVSPDTSLIVTIKPPPPCRFASKSVTIGSMASLCSCPMIAKFSFCAFSHPPHDFVTKSDDIVTRSNLDTTLNQNTLIPPEFWMALLSSPNGVLLDRFNCDQRVRLLRHNCESETGWSYVRLEDGEVGDHREGFVASSCVGLPRDVASDWQPPVYDVDSHKRHSVFKQWQPSNFRSIIKDSRNSIISGEWKSKVSLLKHVSKSPSFAEGVIESHLSAYPMEAAALQGSLQPIVGLICSTKPLLVVDGLKLLAMQLKDVGICATMVRCGIIQHIRACVDKWDKSRAGGLIDDASDAVISDSCDGPDDVFFDELCARVCDLLVVICHHACNAVSASVWFVACEDIRSARLRRMPSHGSSDDAWLEPAVYLKNGEPLTLVRRAAEWSLVRSNKGAEGYILHSQLMERNLQTAIFDDVVESEWFFHLVHIMAENDHADKVHGIIVLLLSFPLSCSKVLQSLITACPSCNIINILSIGLDSCAIAPGSCTSIRIMLHVLYFYMIDAPSHLTSHMDSWVLAAQRVLRFMHRIVFETDPLTAVMIEELSFSFAFLQRLLSWSAAECIVRRQLLHSRVFPKRKFCEEVTFVAALQHIISVVAVGGSGAGLSRAIIARVDPAADQTDRFPAGSLSSLVQLLLTRHLKRICTSDIRRKASELSACLDNILATRSPSPTPPS